MISLLRGASAQTTVVTNTPAPTCSCATCLDPVMMFFLGMLSAAVIVGILWYVLQRRRASKTGPSDKTAPSDPVPRQPSTWPYLPRMPTWPPSTPVKPAQAGHVGLDQGLGWYQTEYQVVSPYWPVGTANGVQ